MTYEPFKQALFTRAAAYGFTDCELYYTASNSFSVHILQGAVHEYKNTDAEGLSFRGTYEGRVGYAYTEKMDESVIQGLIENAAGNAGVIEEKEIEKLYPGDPAYPETHNFNPALNDYTAADKIEMALAMERHAFALDARVKGVDYCALATEESAVRIANSYGLDVGDNGNFAIAYVMARVEENGVTKTGFEIWHGNDFKTFSAEETARVAVSKALSYLGAASLESGAYPVVFNNETAIDMLSCFAGIFFAENTQKGFSLLNGKVGTTIASEAVTLRDDGVCALSFGSVAFDSEGVATQNKTVIENGVFKTLLYNTKSAEKDGVSSTGNGFRPSFRAAVGTSCTNFYITPSDVSVEAMTEGIERGLLITELAGLHSGANTVSGDFSLSADGFLIENGKKVRPVEQITVAGNFYEMLQNIAVVANDLRFSPPSGSGSIGSPSLLAHGLRVSGL